MAPIKILITGANGQLGNEFRSLEEAFSSDFRFLFTDVNELDITKNEKVDLFFIREKPDYTVNCAAYTAVDKAESDQEIARLLNCEAVEILGNAVEKHNSRLIHISTDYVFDGMNHKPYIEEDLVSPMSVYGRTKLDGEIVLKNNKNAMTIRTSWLYSSYGNNFVKTMIRLGKERDILKVVYDQIGTPTYARDLAKSILQIIVFSETEKNGFLPGIYHYSNEGVCSWYDFAVNIFHFLKIDCRVEPILSHEFPTPVKRPHFSVLDKGKIKKTFDIKSIPYWKESLYDCLEIIK